MVCEFKCLISLKVLSPLVFTVVKYWLLRGCCSRIYKRGHLDFTMENQGVRNGNNDFEVREKSI